MIVLDTTVLVYAKGLDHPLREPCRTLIERVSVGVVRATTTVEVIQEFMHVRARRTSRPDAVAMALEYVDLLAPLLVVTADHLRAAASLFQAHPRLGSFDAVLSAAAIEAGVDALVSADVAYRDVPGLTAIDPIDALGLDR